MQRTHIATLLLSVLILWLGCKKESSEEGQANQTIAVVPVEVAPVRQGSISVSIEAVGQTEALRKETVLSPLAGTVVGLKALEGTVIRSGDTLAVIQTKESQSMLAGAQALLAAAITPEQKKEAERVLELAKSNQTEMAVIASSSGIVASRSVVEGSLIAEGGEILTLMDPVSVDFFAQVQFKYLALIAIGQAAEVSFASVDGKPFRAVVGAISPGSDPQTQTVRVRLHFVNLTSEQRISMKDGISGTARIVTGERTGVLLVPPKALLRNDDNDTYTVVTVTGDSLSRSIPVSVGIVEDSIAEVSGIDLHTGMSVIVTGNYALADSTRVTVHAGNAK
jgi:multidrug efflux pump subunit AcrA (membrane-fusion protein)